MMMNEFGVPMNDAEMAMVPNPGKAMLQEQLATSGMENQWVGAAIGAAVSIGGSIIGGNKQADAAEAQAEANNKAAHAKYQYDLDLWDMKKSQLQAQRQEAIDNIMADARNEGKARAWKDAAALDAYDFNLRIRDRQQKLNEDSFKKSTDIYDTTVDMNMMSAKAAFDNNIVALQEAQDELRYERNETYLESIVAEGQLRARVSSGRSGQKGKQATLADYGRQMEMLNATNDSLARNTRSVLEEIIQDRTSADLQAYANKMLDPGILPKPVKPQPIPVPEYTLPRALHEYDFGPQPVMGAMADPGAARDAVWGNTITSIAGSVGGFASGFGNVNANTAGAPYKLGWTGN